MKHVSMLFFKRVEFGANPACYIISNPRGNRKSLELGNHMYE